MPIQQPSNQIKLTNVSLVRLKKGKKRCTAPINPTRSHEPTLTPPKVELACYKNKVLEWRSGIEKDLDNVLQIPSVFLNVSKGQTAPTAELQKAFGKDGKDVSVDDIILEILKKGELQVGEKERTAQLERVHAEVVSIVAAKLVDPRTKRVYTSGMIEKALDMLSSQAHTTTATPEVKDGTTTPPAAAAAAEGEEAAAPAGGEEPASPKPEEKALPKAKEHHWTGVVATKSAKSQALEAMKALIAAQPIPVARARMKLRVTCPTGVLKQSVKNAPKKDLEEGEHKPHGTVKEKILSYVEQIEKQDVVGSEWEVVGFVEPGAFKGLSDFIGSETKGQGRVEVLDMAVMHED